MDIIDKLKWQWRTGSMLIKIIFLNVGIFVLLHVVTLILSFSPLRTEDFLHWIEFPSMPDEFVRRPWSIVTYMFSQYEFFHLLFNMLWLYWFGAIFLFSDSGKRLLALYIYGGVGGAALFMAAYNLLGQYGWLIGSSASVIAIVVATAIIHPDYRMSLLFIGEISLKWIAVITIAIDLMSVSGTNGGGHIAHVGGAIVGALYAVLLKHGVDLTKPFNKIADAFANLWKGIKEAFSKPASPKFDYRAASRAKNTAKSSVNNSRRKDFDEASLDAILDKIKKSGYTSLSDEEKKKLFEQSRHIK